MAKKKNERDYTRFEKARILGARALQLSMGATPEVKIGDSIDPIDIARLELEDNVLPLDVRKKELKK